MHFATDFSVRAELVCGCTADMCATLQVGYVGVGVRVEGTRPRSSGRFSPQPSSVADGDGVTEAAVEQALRLVLSEDCIKAAGRYRELLEDEDGVEIACAKISAVVNSRS